MLPQTASQRSNTVGSAIERLTTELRDRNDSPLLRLLHRQSNKASGEVDLRPLQVEEVRLAKSCIECDDEDGFLGAEPLEDEPRGIALRIRTEAKLSRRVEVRARDDVCIAAPARDIGAEALIIIEGADEGDALLVVEFELRQLNVFEFDLLDRAVGRERLRCETRADLLEVRVHEDAERWHRGQRRLRWQDDR